MAQKDVRGTLAGHPVCGGLRCHSEECDFPTCAVACVCSCSLENPQSKACGKKGIWQAIQICGNPNLRQAFQGWMVAKNWYAQDSRPLSVQQKMHPYVCIRPKNTGARCARE